MDNKKSPSKKKLLSIQEEKLIREVNYDSPAGGSDHLPKEQIVLDLEILQTRPSQRPGSQRVLVSIKPRSPAIKTLYIAEKSRFHSRKGSDKSGSRLAIGDHSSFTTYFSEDDPNIDNLHRDTEQPLNKSEEETDRTSSTAPIVSSTVSKCSQIDSQLCKINVYNIKQRPVEECYVYTQPLLSMNLPKADLSTDKKTITKPNKNDISTLIVTNTSSEELSQPSRTTINVLNKRIDHLERKILRQQMVFRSIDPNIPLSSSNENSKVLIMKSTSGTDRPGCSYIEQYSHIPETSAFQRYPHKASPVAPSKATLEKEHNSEQYGRDFTTYDGITARGRRQCASVPCKRDEAPKMAAERLHKIRHKLNPVRDYRLMDTVHYLAQGEFAPRDDGIKLTPSREAVLSDIIWEDVCRTHWPTARIGRRLTQTERCNTRCELQRLIDSLLRERVAHMERRRRRHYRIVKLNHRHESCAKPMGKTGDIIVASHKHKHCDDGSISDHTANAKTSERRRQATSSHGSPRSHDHLVSQVRTHHNSNDHSYSYENSPAGTSNAANRSPSKREPTYCYQASSPQNQTRYTGQLIYTNNRNPNFELTSTSSSSKTKCPRLVVKKERGYRRQHCNDEPNLEHYILLPTLVVRTPSNMKRQKKFNELYHRILNVQGNNATLGAIGIGSEPPPKNTTQISRKKDIGLNINITLSNSSELISQGEK